MEGEFKRRGASRLQREKLATKPAITATNRPCLRPPLPGAGSSTSVMRYPVKTNKGVLIMTRRTARPNRPAARSSGVRGGHRPASPA